MRHLGPVAARQARVGPHELRLLPPSAQGRNPVTTAPLEAKVAASSGAALLVYAVFAVLHWAAPSLRTPPQDVVTVLTVLATLTAGYLAPHTTRLKPLTAGELAALDHVLAGPQPAVSARPPATYSTGTPPPGFGQGYAPAAPLPSATPAAPQPEGKTAP